MNKIHSALLGSIMALSLAACSTTGTGSSGSSMGTGTTGSSPSGQSGTNTGTTNNVGATDAQTPPVTNSSDAGTGR